MLRPAIRSILVVGLLFLSATPLHALSLDPTFGTGGVATLGFATSSDHLRDLAIQPDGKIVAAGDTSGGMLVARVNADGSLDASFGAGGYVTVSGPATEELAIQSDGKIVVVGESNSKFFVTRLLPADGALDATFGSGGTALVAPRSLSVSARAMTLQVVSGEECIVLAGMLRKGGGAGDFGLMRLRPSGAVDTTFGSAGAAQTDLGGSDMIFGITVDASNRIVAVGIAGGARSSIGDDFGIARYTASGQLDTTFGSGGKQRTDFAGRDERAQSVTVQADGKVVVCGSVHNGLNFDVGVARYTASGALDVTFGYGGRVQVDLFGGSEHANAVVTQTVTNPDSTTRERLLVGGETNTGAGYDALVAAFDE